MIPILLTSDERTRFARYLEAEAHSDKKLAIECEKIGHSTLAQKYRVEAMAAEVLAKKLRQTETMTLPKDDSS